MINNTPGHPPRSWSRDPWKKNPLSGPLVPLYRVLSSGYFLWGTLFFSGCASNALCGPSVDRIEPPFAVVEFSSGDFRPIALTSEWFQGFEEDLCTRVRLQENSRRVLRLMEKEGVSPLKSLGESGL